MEKRGIEYLEIGEEKKEVWRRERRGIFDRARDNKGSCHPSQGNASQIRERLYRG